MFPLCNSSALFKALSNAFAIFLWVNDLTANRLITASQYSHTFSRCNSAVSSVSRKHTEYFWPATAVMIHGHGRKPRSAANANSPASNLSVFWKPLRLLLTVLFTTVGALAGVVRSRLNGTSGFKGLGRRMRLLALSNEDCVAFECRGAGNGTEYCDADDESADDETNAIVADNDGVFTFIDTARDRRILMFDSNAPHNGRETDGGSDVICLSSAQCSTSRDRRLYLGADRCWRNV